MTGLVASASGAGVRLCPSALDGGQPLLVLLRRLRLWRLRLLVASVPGSAVAIGRAYCSMSSSLLVRMWCRVLSSGGLEVPCSLCSPAGEILSFFLGIFRGGSSRMSSSHCWSLLNWMHLSVFRPASAGGRSPLWPSDWQRRSSAAADRSRPGMGGRLSSLPSGEAGCGYP